MYNREFEDFFRLFDFERNEKGECHSPDWPLFRSTEAISLVKDKAASYLAQGGLVSVSHFQRAFADLRASGELHQVRQSDPLRAAYDEPEEPALTRDAYYRMPAATIIRRYRGEPEFRASVDRLIARGEI
jgi:hypothetical protein